MVAHFCRRHGFGRGPGPGCVLSRLVRGMSMGAGHCASEAIVGNGAVDLDWASAAELRRAFAGGEVSPREVLSSVLARAKRSNSEHRAFLAFMEDAATEQAAAAERAWTERRRRGELSDAPPLLGVPVSVKDTVDVAGVPTTMGSLETPRDPAAEDELCVARLREAGAVLFGKTNCPEFGLAAHTINRLGDPCANPWDLTRTCGGSSGGAAAACAAGLGPLHHGTDGGGSIRIPAAYCGVVGLKPSGRVVTRRRRGAGIGQFEGDGAVARTVGDAGLLLKALLGESAPDQQLDGAPDNVRGLTLCAPPALASEAVAAGVSRAIEALREAGATVTESMPELPVEPADLIGAVSSAGAVAEYSEFADRDGARLSSYAAASLARGAALSGADIAATYAEIDLLSQTMGRFFERHHALVLPATPTSALPNRSRIPFAEGGTVSPWLLATLHVPLANLIHAPAAVVPSGFDERGLPTSVQIVAKPGDENTVLRCAKALEAALPWRDRRPPLGLQPPGGR